MNEEIKIEESKDRERATLALEVPVEPINIPLRVIVLQHPQEPDKVLGTAALLVRCLKNSRLKVGLSWRNLKAAAGEESAIPSQWGVLYMGSKGQDYSQEVNFCDPKGRPQSGHQALKGIILIDGTWSQAKALWWRNSWLTKVRRVVLQPKQTSLYGKLRKEPRKEAVSTIEAAALTLRDLGYPVPSELLNKKFAEMLDLYKERKKPAQHPAVNSNPVAKP